MTKAPTPINGRTFNKALLFVKYYGDKIKLINTTGNGYVYDEETALWELKEPLEISVLISQLFQKIMDKEINSCDDDKRKKELTNNHYIIST